MNSPSPAMAMWLTISPVLARVGMAETVAKLRAMPKPSSIEIYEPAEFPDRERC